MKQRLQPIANALACTIISVVFAVFILSSFLGPLSPVQIVSMTAGCVTMNALHMWRSRDNGAA